MESLMIDSRGFLVHVTLRIVDTFCCTGQDGGFSIVTSLI